MHILKLKLLNVCAALLLLFGHSLYAQNISLPQKDHQYGHIDDYSAFLTKTAHDNAAGLNKKIQKEYLKTITEKNAGLIKSLNDNDFLFDATVYPYLSAIFNHILEKNGLDKNQFHFFIDRTSSVNAYSYEDGTVVCNLGLLNLMENESQLAMIFCHELGHYLLKHVNVSITSQLERYHSREFNIEIKKIKKQEYNVNTQLEALLTTDVFDRSKHNRGQERAADSLGVVLFCKTGYNGTNVSHMFDLLEASESNRETGILKNFFNAESLPVENSLLRPVKRMSFGVVKKELVDSLKTHPDCAGRKATMQAYFNDHPKTGVDFLTGDIKKLNDVQKVARFDEAGYAKQKDNLGYYFYQLIQLNTLYPANGYVKTETFNTLLSFCNHQQAHTLYTVVNTKYIAGDDNDEYAILLKMLDSIDFDTLKAVTIKYYNNNKSLITASGEAINNLKLLKINL